MNHGGPKDRGVDGFHRATQELSDMESLLRAMEERRQKPRPELAVEYVAPRDSLEVDLVDLWRELLGVERVGVRDRWLELGGQSLTAVRMLARVAEDHDSEIALHEFFEAPSVDGLGRRIREGEKGSAPSEAAAGSEVSAPLAPGQERLWVLDRLHPGAAGYNVFLALRISRRLNVVPLEQAFAEVVRRHEILRTSFPEEAEGRPRQVVLPGRPRPLPGIDLSRLERGDRKEWGVRLGRAFVERPFDLARGPLVRFAVVRQARDEHLLVLCLHHIVADGWSTGLLQRELLRLYGAYSGGEPSPLEPLRSQYRHYVAWQSERLGGGELARQLDHWRNRLGAVAPRPRPESADGADEPPGWHGSRAPVELDEGLTRSVELFAQRLDLSLFMTLLAAFYVLLWWSSDRDEVLVGSPVAGRSRPEFLDLIGFFVNTIVLRVELDEALSFQELAERVRQEALGAYAASAVPFERVISALGVERDLSRPAIFEAWFVLQDEEPRLEPPPGVTVRSENLDLHLVRHDLALDLVRTHDGIRGGVFYRVGRLDAVRARVLARGLEIVLKTGVARPEVLLSELARLLDRLDEEVSRERKARFHRSLKGRLGGLVRRSPLRDGADEGGAA